MKLQLKQTAECRVMGSIIMHWWASSLDNDNNKDNNSIIVILYWPEVYDLRCAKVEAKNTQAASQSEPSIQPAAAAAAAAAGRDCSQIANNISNEQFNGSGRKCTQTHINLLAQHTNTRSLKQIEMENRKEP